MSWTVKDYGDRLQLEVEDEDEDKPWCLACLYKEGRRFELHFPLDEDDIAHAKVMLYEALS